MTTDYLFRPMTPADLPQIRRWLALPHVREWWGDPCEQYALVSGDLDEPAMDQYIFSAAGKAFGYLQCYDLTAWNAGFGPQPAGTCGIDLLIGEPNLIERGHGSALLRAFADRLLRNGAPRIVTDPDPENGRAVRAYQISGFEKDRMVDTPDGPALLMVRNTWRRAYRPDPAADRLVIGYRLSSQHFNLARAHDRLLPP